MASGQSSPTTDAGRARHATFRQRANTAVESPVVTALDQVKAVLEEGELVQSKTTPKPLLESKLSADVGDHVNPDSVQQLQDHVQHPGGGGLRLGLGGSVVAGQ